jgi:hypothetical protein
MIQIFIGWQYGRLRHFNSHSNKWSNYRMVAQGVLDTEYFPASIITKLDKEDLHRGSDPVRTTEEILQFTLWSNVVF